MVWIFPTSIEHEGVSRDGRRCAARQAQPDQPRDEPTRGWCGGASSLLLRSGRAPAPAPAASKRGANASSDTQRGSVAQ